MAGETINPSRYQLESFGYHFPKRAELFRFNGGGGGDSNKSKLIPISGLPEEYTDRFIASPDGKQVFHGKWCMQPDESSAFVLLPVNLQDGTIVLEEGFPPQPIPPELQTILKGAIGNQFPQR